MGAFDHWQPVMTSKELGRNPSGLVICGEEIVVFRTRDGVGALKDRCPHRGMRLSKGHVEQDRLFCPYHGWSYTRDGQGESPGTPKLRACAKHFEALELHGLIWLKNAEVSAPFPAVDAAGHTPVCQLDYTIAGPLEVVLDNFNEVEHTPTTHALLGYDLSQMPRVETKTITTEDTVRVINKGPQKPIPWVVSKLFEIHPGDTFTDDWTTYFSPVYSVFDQYWTDPETGKERPVRLRIVVFFTPIDDHNTRVFVFVQSSAGITARKGLYFALRPVLTRLVDHEVKLDKAMIEQLADKSPSLQGRKLSRFDKALGENRRRIATIYRGNENVRY